MRLNLPCFKARTRAPQNEKKVPFKELYPLALSNKIDARKKVNLEDKCLFEMSLLMGCWKNNEFNNNSCIEFAEKLKRCYMNLMENMKVEKELRKRDVPTPETKNFTEKQLNYLLHKYPNV